MNRDAQFWDRMARRYCESPIKDMASYEATLERAQAHLRPEMSALELGCGTGMTAVKLAPSAGEYLATDISGEMVKFGRERATEAGSDNLRFAQACLEDDSLHGETFDAVLGFNYLHLLPDTRAALARIHDLTRPGGVFISKTVCLDHGLWFMRALLPLMLLVGKAPRHVRFLTVKKLETQIEEAGFEIIETASLPKKPLSRFVVARRPA